MTGKKSLLQQCTSAGPHQCGSDRSNISPDSLQHLHTLEFRVAGSRAVVMFSLHTSGTTNGCKCPSTSIVVSWLIQAAGTNKATPNMIRSQAVQSATGSRFRNLRHTSCGHGSIRLVKGVVARHFLLLHFFTLGDTCGSVFSSS